MTYFFASLLSGARGVAGTPPVRPVLLECPVTVSVGILSPRLKRLLKCGLVSI